MSKLDHIKIGDTDYEVQDSELTSKVASLETSVTAVQTEVENKQDKLTAGGGIEIKNNIISVLSYHYSKFTFEGSSGILTSVEGECATAFDSTTQTIDMVKARALYPFNQFKLEELQLQNSSGTNLSGLDKFSTFPNLYYSVTIGSDGMTATFEFADYKANDNMHRVYEDDIISRCAIATYFATLDSNNLMRSNNYTNNGLIAVNYSQVTAESRLPYFNGSKVDYLDSRVLSAYVALAVCYIGARNTQKIFSGIVDYTAYSYNYNELITNFTSSNVKGTAICGATDNILSSTTMTGEVTTWTENDVTTELASGKRPFAILGVENPFGLLWQNVSGLLHDSQNLYQYQSTTHLVATSSWNNSGYTQIASNLCANSGWQKTLSQSNGVVYPTSVGGNDSTLVGDYYWYSSGQRLFIFGGAWYNGFSCGLSYLLGEQGWGRASTSIAFRLSLKY